MGLVEKFAAVEMGGTAGRGELCGALAREQSVHAHSMDWIARASRFSLKNTASMYVAMLVISVTKASM